jgi:hypothetical protein
VIEPRNVTDRGADVVNRTEDNIECVVVAGRIRPAGVEEQSMFAKGLPRNLEILPVSTSAGEGRED